MLLSQLYKAELIATKGTTMPKLADRTVLIRSYQLRRQGNTIDSILDRLHSEFSLARIPDRATIARNLKKFEADRPEELKEDLPFDWTKMGDVAGAREMLNVHAFYETNGHSECYGPFTQRLAKWTWRVLNAVECQDEDLFTPFWDPERHWQAMITQGGELDGCEFLDHGRPSENDIIGIAMEYNWREMEAVMYETPTQNEDLNMWLAFKPWTGPASAGRYAQWKTDTGRSWIRWHFDDVDWLDRIDPALSAHNRLHMPDLVDAHNDENIPPLKAASLQAADVLIRSQTWIARWWMEWELKSGTSQRHPKEAWYIGYYSRLCGLLKQGDEAGLSNYVQILDQIREEVE